MNVYKDVFINVTLDSEVLYAVRSGLTKSIFVKGSESHMGEVGNDDTIKLIGNNKNFIYVKVISKRYLAESFGTEFSIQVI